PTVSSAVRQIDRSLTRYRRSAHVHSFVSRVGRGYANHSSKTDRVGNSAMRSPLVLMGCLLTVACGAAGAPPRSVDWPSVGNDAGCMRYSELTQINRETVRRLKPVWTYHTRELEGRTGKTIECTPIVIDGVMYVTTGYLRVVALDAATGKELWQFDP